MSAKNRRTKTGYSGALARPFPPLPPKGDRRYQAEAEARQVEMARRAQLLAEHHGVTDGDPYSMLTALIHAHVPGFRLAKKAGRKRQWFPHHFAEVRTIIDSEFVPTGFSIRKAAGELSKREPWRSFRATPEVIRRMYYAGRKAEATMIEASPAAKKLAAAISSQD